LFVRTFVIATRSARAGEAARESACRGVRGAKPLGKA
jgi:hypothetical protein